MEGDGLGDLVAGEVLGEFLAHESGVDGGVGIRLHGGAQDLAEIVVGNAEDTAVGDAGNLQKLGLDLGGIDVHAARDHHVVAAVAEIDEAIRVLVADIADADETVAFGLAALLVVAVIGEVEPGGQAHVEIAGFALGHVSAILVEDAELHILHGAADRAGMGEPFGRRAEHHGAGFGGAVILVDDRSPPFNHRALDVRGTGRRGVDDELQRGEVVLPADLLRQLQQAHEHGRHHLDVRDAVFFDEPQQVFRIEAGLQNDVRADADGEAAIGVGGRVVHWAGDDRDDLLRPGIEDIEPEHRADRQGAGERLLRGGGRAADALGPAGGAAGIDHGAWRIGDLRRAALETGEPGIPIGAAGGHGGGGGIDLKRGDDFRRRGNDEDGHALRQRRLDALQEIGVNDDRLGAAVAEEIVGLVDRVVPVHWHGIAAELADRGGGFEEREIVAQHDRDGVAASDAECGEARGGALRAILKLVERQRALAGDELGRHGVPS